MNPTLTVFSNFFINTEECFLRMKDSFASLNNLPWIQSWVINVRGSFADEVSQVLQQSLGKKLILTRHCSKRGWFYDTRKMLSDVQSDFVFIWIEDHIRMASEEQFLTLIREMKETHSDFFIYTYFNGGQIRNRYRNIQSKEHKTLIDSFEINRENVHLLEKEKGLGYILALPGIYSTELFKKVASSNHPYLRRWPKECPFDWEKTTKDTLFLPFKVAEPKIEFFASIDDDHSDTVLPKEQACLIRRGFYSDRIQRSELIFHRNKQKKWCLLVIRKFFPTSIYRLLRRISYHF